MRLIISFCKSELRALSSMMRSETGEKNSRGSLVSGVFAGGRGQLRGRKNADTRLISVAGTCAPRFSVIRLGAVSGVIRDYHISPITLPTVEPTTCVALTPPRFIVLRGRPRDGTSPRSILAFLDDISPLTYHCSLLSF